MNKDKFFKFNSQHSFIVLSKINKYIFFAFIFNKEDILGIANYLIYYNLINFFQNKKEKFFYFVFVSNFKSNDYIIFFSFLIISKLKKFSLFLFQI